MIDENRNVFAALPERRDLEPPHVDAVEEILSELPPTHHFHGCGSSVACGLVAAKLATGKKIDEAALIGGDAILDVLKGLVEKERHCAYLAAETLQAAIHYWMVREWVGKRNP